MAAPAALTERLLAPCVLHKPLVARHEVCFSDYERLQPLHLAARDASPRESCASSIRGVSGIRVPLQVAVAAQVPSRGVSSGIPSRAGRYLDVVLARAGRLASHAPVLAVSSAARHPRGREALHDQHSIRPSRSPITNRRAVACRASDQAERPTSGGYEKFRTTLVVEATAAYPNLPHYSEYYHYTHTERHPPSSPPSPAWRLRLLLGARSCLACRG